MQNVTEQLERTQVIASAVDDVAEELTRRCLVNSTQPHVLTTPEFCIQSTIVRQGFSSLEPPLVVLPKEVLGPLNTSLPLGVATATWLSNPLGNAAITSSGQSVTSPPIGPMVSITLIAPDGTILQVTDLTQPLVFLLPFETTDLEELTIDEVILCRYWSVADRAWRSDGCRLLQVLEGPVARCSCTHLTQFSVGVESLPAWMDNFWDDFAAAWNCANMALFSEDFLLLLDPRWLVNSLPGQCYVGLLSLLVLGILFLVFFDRAVFQVYATRRTEAGVTLLTVVPTAGAAQEDEEMAAGSRTTAAPGWVEMLCGMLWLLTPRGLLTAFMNYATGNLLIAIATYKAGVCAATLRSIAADSGEQVAFNENLQQKLAGQSEESARQSLLECRGCKAMCSRIVTAFKAVHPVSRLRLRCLHHLHSTRALVFLVKSSLSWPLSAMWYVGQEAGLATPRSQSSACSFSWSLKTVIRLLLVSFLTTAVPLFFTTGLFEPTRPSCRVMTATTVVKLLLHFVTLLAIFTGCALTVLQILLTVVDKSAWLFLLTSVCASLLSSLTLVPLLRAVIQTLLVKCWISAQASTTTSRRGAARVAPAPEAEQLPSQSAWDGRKPFLPPSPVATTHGASSILDGSNALPGQTSQRSSARPCADRQGLGVTGLLAALEQIVPSGSNPQGEEADSEGDLEDLVHEIEAAVNLP